MAEARQTDQLTGQFCCCCFVPKGSSGQWSRAVVTSGHCSGCHSQTRAHLLTSTHCGHMNYRFTQMTCLSPPRGHHTGETGRGPTRELGAVHTVQLPSTRKGAIRPTWCSLLPWHSCPLGLRHSVEAQGPALDHDGLQHGDHPAEVTDGLRWARAELARAG